MNTKTTLTFKIEKKLRDAAKRRAAQFGIPLTTVLNTQLAEFAHSDRFEISLTPRPEKLREWAQAVAEYKAHPERFKTFDNVDDLFADMGLS